MRTISLLGSTGSIGRQSLDVIAACGMEAAALTANSNAARMEEQVRQFKPELAVMMDERAAADLRVRLADTPVRGASGMEGLLEAAELLEIFQWSGANLECRDKLGRIREELADVLSYCVLMADVCGLDLDEILNAKVDQNAAKYPVEKARGSAAKYTELT